jgi:hypothetical protein
MSREHALTLLWKGFKCHLMDSWHDYAAFGETLDEAKEQIKFCEVVTQHMQVEFTQKSIEFETLNHLTLYNYFKTDGFSLHAKTKTLNTFSALIGHQNWDTFLARVEKQEITDEMYSACSYAPSSDKKIKNEKTRPFPKWMIAAIAILLVMAFFFMLSNKSQSIQHKKEMIKQVVLKANEAEFQAYKNIPRIDSNQLKKYFVEEGTAYNSVLGLLLRSQKRNRKLLIPPSSYVVEKISVEEVNRDVAIANTTEHWIIRWRDLVSNKEILYDTVNQHTYYLKNIDGAWKISVDDYTGKARIPASAVGR